MPRFLTGDELGSIKAVSYDPDEPTENKTQPKTLYDGTTAGRTRGIQRLVISRETVDHPLLASAHADGSVSLSLWTGEDKVEPWHEWKETRIKPDQTFVGLAASRDSVFSCTSNGALRLTTTGEENSSPLAHKLAALPSRLTTWRSGHKQETFAYGGEEVEVSVWNTERAFAPPSHPSTPISTSKKRKRSEALFPGEIWRAKNVPNDFLGLRQPVHNTCLTYLPSSSASSHQLLVGTRLGDIRRYDTRVGRRPANEFKGVGKVGGVKSVEKGHAEHEIFVSDQGTNLFALDLRNGRILYGYKGISGAVNAVSSAPSFLASVSLDRYARIHSTFAPPDELGQQLKARGTTLEKVYMTTTPTVILWDGDTSAAAKENEEDVWDRMKNVDG